MLCKKCGAENRIGTELCVNCGTRLPAPFQRRKPQKNTMLTQAGGMVRQYLNFAIAFILVVSLILAVTNLFGTYQVTVKVSFNGYVSKTTETLRHMYKDGFGLALVSALLFGFANLAIGAICVLYFMKVFIRSRVYDRYIARYLKGSTLLFPVGLLGGLTALFQLIVFLSGRAEFLGEVTKIRPHWSTWLAFLFYAHLVAVDKLMLNKK